jgi:uncharacterized membrane protein YjjB (DUF3815 family)
LATSGSAVLGAVVVPLLVGMLGEEWQTFTVMGKEFRTETAFATALFAGGLLAHYIGIQWSPLLLNASVGSLCAAIGMSSRELGEELRPTG